MLSKGSQTLQDLLSVTPFLSIPDLQRSFPVCLVCIFRLNGCYEALEGGNTTEALIDFTGGVSEPLSLDREALSLHSEQRKALFQTLAKAHERKALITCSIRVRRQIYEQRKAKRSIKDHFTFLSLQTARRWNRYYTVVSCEDTPTGSQQ